MLGLTPYDDNQVINEYKDQFGITNPCAGMEGNSGEAIAKIIDGQNFYGYPTYCVVCPDLKLHFGICFPPEPECFDEYIISCGALSTDESDASLQQVTVYPNPASTFIDISSGQEKIKSVVLFNSMGEMVKNLTSSSNLMRIPVDGLPKGIYMVKTETGSGTVIRKVSIY